MSLSGKCRRLLCKLQGKKTRSFDPGILKDFPWKSTDVVISSGAKQGTNWTLNIAHQLRMLGDNTFSDILTVCLWVEFLSHPKETRRERLERAEKHNEIFPFRIFKTHEAPPVLPFHEERKYIIPIRNGKDTLVSDYYFSQSRTDEFNRIWGADTTRIEPFSSYLKRYIKDGAYWRFINSWWKYRHHDNVFFVHFNDLKKNPEKNIRQIAVFLNIQIPDERWPAIFEYCSFDWMKKHSVKFESPHFTKAAKMIKDGGMIRKGMIGEHRNLFTDHDNQAWNRSHRKYFPDRQQREWTDAGGPLP